MADEKTPLQPAPGDDLKARLRLSAKSLRQQQQEEEERRRAEEEARKKAEADKAKRERERQAQFSMALGGAPGATPGAEAPAAAQPAPRWTLPSEEELEKLQELRPAHKGRKVITVIVSVVILVGALAFGYYFGRALFGRQLENNKIQEARDVLTWHISRRPQFEAIDQFKGKIDEMLELLSKPGITPEYQVEKLLEFISICERFIAMKPFTARDVYPTDVYNSEVATAVIAYIDNLNRLTMATDQMLRERDILALVGTGKEDAPGSAAEKRPATVMFASAPKGDAQIPWNDGEVVGFSAESFKQLRRVDPPPPTDPAAPPVAPRYLLPVVKGSSGETVEADTGFIVEFDSAPLFRKEATLYRLALLERVKTTLLDMKAMADKIAWPEVEKIVREHADKEFYFTI